MLGLLAPEWRLLIAAGASLVAAAIAQATIPHFISQTLKAIIDGQAAGTLSRSTFSGRILNLLLASTAGAVFSSLRGASFIAVGSRASVRLRTQLFKSLLRQDIGFFDTTKTGEVTSRLTQDCQRVADQVTFNVNFFSRTVVELITTLCFMLFYSTYLTGISFVTVPVIVLLSKKIGGYMKKLSEETQQRLAEANAVADEAIASIATVRTFAGERVEEGRFRDKMQEYMTLEIRRAKIYVGYLSSVMLLPQLGNVFVLFQIGVLCMNGLPAPTLLAFVFYLQTLNSCFGSVADIYTSIMQALGSATRVFELIDRVPSGSLRVAEGSPSALALAASPGMAGRLQLVGVHFNYPARPERPALQGLDLDCPAGTVMALVGPSGGGKSTCISLFQRLYEPQHGRVLVDGREVGEYDSDAYSAMVTTVSQEPVLFASTVRDNILYGLPEQHPARLHGGSGDEHTPCAVEYAAKLANAHDFISAMPQGYETEVGERGVQLSGGQKQRIAIARALVRGPRVLLLDEATSALDAESEMLVQQAISNLIAKRDLTVVIVAHRLSTVKQADKICVVRDGRIVEEGVHEDLLRLPNGQYRRLVQQQLQGPVVAGA